MERGPDRFEIQPFAKAIFFPYKIWKRKKIKLANTGEEKTKPAVWATRH